MFCLLTWLVVFKGFISAFFILEILTMLLIKGNWNYSALFLDFADL